jgi:hypothetical protein
MKTITAETQRHSLKFLAVYPWFNPFRHSFT